MKISILGAGTWGTALANTLAQIQHEVLIWSALPDEIDILKKSKRHKNLPGMVLSDRVQFTKSIEEATVSAEVLIVAVPSVFVRSTAESFKPYLKKDQIIACVAKGIEEGTLFTMSEVICDAIGEERPVVGLSGPTHAEEVALGVPTLIVSACKDHDIAKFVQELFVGTCIRPYSNPDIKGVEICGALKNIMALACGISAGLGFGDNTRAAIMTRGMAEIVKLGTAMGCAQETFYGLAGIGDLIVTASSKHSRNNQCGTLMGQGVPAKEAMQRVGMVVEGINAIPACLELADKYQVEMPIVDAVNRVVLGECSPEEMAKDLLSRSIRPES